MTISLFLDEPLDGTDTNMLAEATDILYRKLRNMGYARKFATHVLPTEHTAIQLAAAKIIKAAPPEQHPVTFINRRNLILLRVGSMSAKQAICHTALGKTHTVRRGTIGRKDKFNSTSANLKSGFAVFAENKGGVLKRVMTLKPTLSYIA